MGVARFAGQALFTSGPVRFREGWAGLAFEYPLSGGNISHTISIEGPLQLTVVQSGRMVEATEALLQVRLDALRAVSVAPTSGTLDSGGQRVWADMGMLRVRYDEFVDAGRVWSVGYSVDYARLV